MSAPTIFLREWRAARRLTQEQLAKRLRTTGATLSRWETSERGLDAGDLLRLARALEITPNDLYLPPDLASFWELRALAERRRP